MGRLIRQRGDDPFWNGPIATPQTRAAKLFAGSYALLSGFVILTVTGIVLGPFVHRVLHRFHLERDENAK